MPSQLHEAMVQLFRNRPELAPKLLRMGLHRELPEYREARIQSAELNQLRPTEYRADLVIQLDNPEAVLGIVVEVQLHADGDKRYSWPVYVATLRERLRCPVWLLVVTPLEDVGRWAAQPVDMGGGNWFVPAVIGPSGAPVITDVELAREDPELAVLSAMAHGPSADGHLAARVAAAALAGSTRLDDDRAALYCDLVFRSLSGAAKEVLRKMEPANYEYQSEFAKRYIAQGVAEGEARGLAQGVAQGRAELLIKLLTLRFGALSPEREARVRGASLDDLDRFAERILSAANVDEVLA